MMLTRCPSCHTAFRVTPEQLKARAGKVRCGHCSAVFNALETLEDAAPPAPQAIDQAPESGPAPAESALTPPSPGEASPAEAAPPEAVTQPATATPPLETEIAPAETTQAEMPARPSRLSFFAWGFGVLIMLALLAAQAAYVFRAELALLQPDWKPALEEMCAMLACDLPLPRKPELVGIEASDLHPDPERAKLLVLAATLKNRAPFVQAYPHLELTLTDTLDQPLARRVLAPEDYLAPGADPRAGFAANGELMLNLWIDASAVAATGYRLYLFYP